jgi:hypothetical protein
MTGRKGKPTPGTCRVGLEITNRSGWLTRAYKLSLLPGRVRVAYADGRTSYDLRFDDETGGPTCTCPAFEADGGCKHLDAVVALMEGLTRRLTPPSPSSVGAA